jgi:hypothetical protein
VQQLDLHRPFFFGPVLERCAVLTFWSTASVASATGAGVDIHDLLEDASVLHKGIDFNNYFIF